MQSVPYKMKILTAKYNPSNASESDVKYEVNLKKIRNRQ